MVETTDLKRAHKVIAEAEATMITTSTQGHQQILDALAKPPLPTKDLIEGMRKYADEADIQWR